MAHRRFVTGNLGRRIRTTIGTAALLACPYTIGFAQLSKGGMPFTLERTISMPAVPPGPYSDFLTLDVAKQRLYATPQAAKAVAVLDLNKGQVLKMIAGIGNPHGIFYSPLFKRLFVADGESGDVKVFDGENFKLLKTILLAKGADALTYDPMRKFIYVNNGGEDADMNHSMISVVDTLTLERVGDIRIESLGLEGSVLNPATHTLYVNLADKNSVAVVDMERRAVVATWPLTHSHTNMTAAVDVANQRLYVGCRDTGMHGTIAVLSLRDGRELATLPIGGWVDSIFFDAKRKRIYSSAGVGHLETYEVLPNDKFRKLDLVDTGVMAKTSLYSPELDRMYVSVPRLGDTPAQVLVFRPAQ